MTISSTDDPRAGPFNGNGSQTAFPFEFKTFSKNDLLVVRTDDDGLEYVLVLDSDFSVALNSDQDNDPGGTVTYPISGAALPVGETLTIASDLDFTQTTDITSGGGFYPQVMENALDRATMLIKQVNEKVDRSLRVAVSTPEGVDPTLPVPVAQKIIGWNDTATGLVNRDITDFATVVAFAAWQSQTFDGDGTATVFTLSSDPGNINNLDIAIGGVTQTPLIDFTLSGTTLTFVSAPPAGTDNVFVRWGQALPVEDSALRIDLISSAGATFVNWLQAGADALVRAAQEKLRERKSLADFGTTADLSTAFTRIKAAYPDSNKIRLPAGTWLMSTGITYTTDRINIEGDGRWASTINFSPAGAATCITFNNPAAGGFNQGSIEGIAFTSSNSNAKTAIHLVNAANVHVSRIAMNASWAGDSIGLRTAGRQFVTLEKSEIVCARPVVISPNVTWPSLATDYFLIENCELVGTSATRPVVEVETGVSFSNMTLRQVGLIGGLHGFYYNDTTSSAAGFKLMIDGMRSEQGIDAAGYALYIASTAQQIQSVTIRNSYLGSERNGIYLRNAQRVILDGVDFIGGVGKVALDMTFVAGSRLTMINCFSQSGSTKVLTNAKCVRRENTTAFGFIEEWVYDSGPVAGAESSDIYHGGVPFTLAAAATQAIADANFTGFLFVSSSQDLSAVFSCLGGTAVTRELLDPDGAYSITIGTASSTNIYWDGGTSRYVLQNNRAATVTYSVYKIGTTV